MVQISLNGISILCPISVRYGMPFGMMNGIPWIQLTEAYSEMT